MVEQNILPFFYTIYFYASSFTSTSTSSFIFSILESDISYATFFSSFSPFFLTYSLLWNLPTIFALSPTSKLFSANLAFLPHAIHGK